MIKDYFLNRENLILAFVLIDSRLEPQKIDLEFIHWLGQNGIPISIIFTKADKQTRNKTQSSIAKFKKVMKSTWEELPPTFTTSSINQEGKDDVLNYINGVIETLE